MKQILISLLVVLGLTACTQKPVDTKASLEKIDNLFKSAVEANHTDWTPEQWRDFYKDTNLLLAEFYGTDPSFEENDELTELTRKYGEIFDRDDNRHLYSMGIWGELNVRVDSETLQFISEDEEWKKSNEVLGKAIDKWAETHYGKVESEDMTEGDDSDNDDERVIETIVNLNDIGPEE